MKIPKMLIAVTVILFVVIVLAMLGTRIRVSLTDTLVTPASERAEELQELLAAVDRGDLADSQYRAVDSYNPESYAFVTYTVALSSFNILPTEWCILNLTPRDADVALVRGEVGTIAPLGGTTITATLLTSADEAESPRNLWVEYYVLGRLYSVNITRGA